MSVVPISCQITEDLGLELLHIKPTLKNESFCFLSCLIAFVFVNLNLAPMNKITAENIQKVSVGKICNPHFQT